MLPIAVFRFSPTEGPAYFADWLDARGWDWQLCALDEGARVPATVRAFAGIVMMGGPMSVNDDLPWLAPLMALLRDARNDRGNRLGRRRGLRCRDARRMVRRPCRFHRVPVALRRVHASVGG